MDNNLYFLQSIGYTGGTYENNTLILTNPTGGTIETKIESFSRNFIPSGTSITIYEDYQNLIFGDLVVQGELNIENNAELVVLNGAIIISGGTINNSGTTYNISLPEVDTKVVGFTYNNNEFTILNNFGSAYTISLNQMTGLTISGDLIVTGNTNNGKIGVNVDNPTNTLHISASTDPIKIESLTANTSDSNVLSIDDTGVVHKYPISGLSKSLLLINTQTSNYTLLLSDQNKLIEMSAATNIDVIVPAYSAVSYDVGTQILLVRGGSGEVSVVADSGVTIKSVNTYLSLNNQYSPATLVKVDVNTWYLFGDLKA